VVDDKSRCIPAEPAAPTTSTTMSIKLHAVIRHLSNCKSVCTLRVDTSCRDPRHLPNIAELDTTRMLFSLRTFTWFKFPPFDETDQRGRKTPALGASPPVR
jgi:hypothetical protein